MYHRDENFLSGYTENELTVIEDWTIIYNEILSYAKSLKKNKRPNFP